MKKENSIKRIRQLVSVRLSAEMNKKFAEHVAKLGISKNAFIINLINKELSKTNKSVKPKNKKGT